ncbi:MAG TPA: hypothetical protein VGD05_08140 [Pyrinomonadaceae bacterium]|jgi:hypothetical protein
MQTVGQNLLAALTGGNNEPKRQAILVEIYSADAEPSADGFSPLDSTFLFGSL